jgi:hypothetical protein
MEWKVVVIMDCTLVKDCTLVNNLNKFFDGALLETIIRAIGRTLVNGDSHLGGKPLLVRHPIAFYVKLGSENSPT